MSLSASLRLLFLVLGSTFCWHAQAQTNGSFIGTVVDAVSGKPLASVPVRILLPDTVLSTNTDPQGAFRFAALPAGVHTLRVDLVGYTPYLLNDVWVRPGRSEQVEVALAPGTTLETVSVTPRHSADPGSYGITVEQGLRMPAMYQDPARLAATVPGVATTNDQGNHFSVRGNGPAANAYLLEGAEIVSPNHLTNAGTVTDLPSLSGGGTSILSAQMLGRSRLLTGSMSAQYGNALGGFLDMRLRPGSAERRGYTLQAGLTGLDASAEGPFRQGGRATYLVNYRYSTVGLLTEMGVDMGDERIGFQDLSIHLNFPMGERSRLSVFGLGGTSHNYFARKDSADRKVDKDLLNIDYTGRMGAAGFSLILPAGPNALWRTTAIYSGIAQEREQRGLPIMGMHDHSQHSLSETKLSVVSHVQGRLGARSIHRSGFSVLRRQVNVDRWVFDVRGSIRPLPGTDDSQLLLRPYIETEHRLGDRWRLDIGFAYGYQHGLKKGVPEPRAGVRYALPKDRSISISAGQRMQLDRIQSYAMSPLRVVTNDPRPWRLQEVVLAYDHPFNDHLVLHAEAFVQRVVGVPLSPDYWGVPQPLNYRALLVNLWDEYSDVHYVPGAEQFNRGAELGLDHSLHNGLYYRINASWVNATSTQYNGAQQVNVRWNNTWASNLIIGKEYAKQKDEIKRTWGVNLRFNAMGGLRAMVIDEAMSERVGTTIVDVSDPWSVQLPAFHRLDLRVYLKRERSGRNGIWAIDLQNVMGTQNLAYRYFDSVQRRMVDKYQLGLIPNLSYRVEF